MNTFELLKHRIVTQEFSCVEDAIDEIVKAYMMGDITTEQRAELLKIA